MLNKNFLFSIITFSILLFFTSIIKNEYRILEKDIDKFKTKIANIEKDLFESQLEYYYLSTPEKLSERIKFFTNDDYLHMDYSNIYLSFKSFIEHQNKLSKK